MQFLRRHWPAFAIVAVIFVLAFFLFYAGGNRERAAQDQRSIMVQEQVGDANANASAARVADAVTIEQQKEELHNATDVPNDDDARRRAGCVILRQQGRDTTSIAACR